MTEEVNDPSLGFSFGAKKILKKILEVRNSIADNKARSLYVVYTGDMMPLNRYYMKTKPNDAEYGIKLLGIGASYFLMH